MLQLTRRASRLSALAIVLAAHFAFAQADTPPVAPAFDVVSIRVVPPDTRITMTGMHDTDNGFDSQSVTASILIRGAYGGYGKFPTDDRVIGLPDWAKTTNFQISAKMNEADTDAFKKLTPDEKSKRRQAMLQAMLADRFQLKAHLESKQFPVYDLVLAKGGPKIKENDTNPDAPKDREGKPFAGSFMMMRGIGKVTAQAFTMANLANFLSQPPAGVGRPVVDKTGLTGKYSFALNWSPPPGLPPGGIPGLPSPPPPPPDSEGGPSIFTALQEQLGLRLQPATADLPIIIVDHIERPSDN